MGGAGAREEKIRDRCWLREIATVDGRSVESAGLFGLVGGRGSERLVGAATATERKGQWGLSWWLGGRPSTWAAVVADL